MTWNSEFGKLWWKTSTIERRGNGTVDLSKYLNIPSKTHQASVSPEIKLAKISLKDRNPLNPYTSYGPKKSSRNQQLSEHKIKTHMMMASNGAPPLSQTPASFFWHIVYWLKSNETKLLLGNLGWFPPPPVGRVGGACVISSSFPYSSCSSWWERKGVNINQFFKGFFINVQYNISS